MHFKIILKFYFTASILFINTNYVISKNNIK